MRKFHYGSGVAGRKTGSESGRKNYFGAKLREIRRARGISVRDMAAKLEARGWQVSETVWGHVESGRRILADTELMMALKVLRVGLSDLEKRSPSRSAVGPR